MYFCECERASNQVCVHVFMCSSFVRLHLCVLFVWLGVISGSILTTWIYFPQEHTSPGITIAMLPPADTFTWALPRRPSQPSSLWDTPASPLRRAWPPTCPRRTIRPSLPCPHPPSSRMCRGLHSYLRPYTSNTSSSSSFLKRSTAGSSRTPGKTSLHANNTKTHSVHSQNQVKHICIIPEEPRSVFPWTLTDCVQATSSPLPSMFHSQWHSSRGTWPKALTGESPLEINECELSWCFHLGPLLSVCHITLARVTVLI